MNMQVNFANLSTDASIEDEKDVLGGGGLLDSDLYATTVELAYLEKSSNGAMGVNLRLKTDTGREIRQTIYMTSGEAKGCKNYYVKDGERRYLPGFILMNSLALLTVGKEIGEVAQAAETKVVNVYNFDLKKEVPTDVPVLVELLGKPILAGVLKQLEDKNAKGDDGVYRPTGETRDTNEIDKFFRAKDRMTTAEIRGGATEGKFADDWTTKWKGVVKDKTDKTKGAVGSPVNRGASGAAGAPKPKQSLFAS